MKYLAFTAAALVAWLLSPVDLVDPGDLAFAIAPAIAQDVDPGADPGDEDEGPAERAGGDTAFARSVAGCDPKYYYDAALGRNVTPAEYEERHGPYRVSAFCDRSALATAN